MILLLTLPLPPSANHSHYVVATKGGGARRFRTTATKKWQAEARESATREVEEQSWTMPEPGAKVVVEFVAYWPDRRKRDVSNLHKVCLDALSTVVYPDDRWVLARDTDFHVDRSNPRIDLLVRLKSGG